MSNFSRNCGLSVLALSVAAVGVQAQNDDALSTWFSQQSIQVHTLVEQLGSSNAERQRFALWQLEIELAVPAGLDTQPILEEAAAAGVLPALKNLSLRSDSEVATTAAALHKNLIAALGLDTLPAQPRSVLNGVASESLVYGDEGSWLALELDAGKEYRVRAPDCDLLSTLIVRADDTEVIDGGISVNRSFSFTSVQDDSVLLRVRPFDCSSTPRITLSAGEPLQHIDGSTTAVAAAPVAKGRYVGRLAEHDQQWMSLRLEQGQSVEIGANPAGSGIDTYITIYDATGRQKLAEDDDGGVGLGSRLTYTSTADAGVLIEVSRLGSSWGEYELTIADVEPPAERGERVLADTDYDGSLSVDAREWWRFEPEAGVRYRVEASPNDGFLDTYLTLYEIDGATLIGEDDDGGAGLGSRFDFSRPSGSPILIQVHGLNEETGTYRLRVSEYELQFDHAEHAVDVGSYRGGVDDGAESFWRLNTPAGRYVVEVVPQGLLDSVITLFDADGTEELGFDDDGGQGFGSRLQFSSAGDTTHILSVGSFSGSGNFELIFSTMQNPAQSAAPANRGGTYHARIDYNAEQWWRLETEPGTSFDIEARPLGDLDTVMELYASDGLTRLNRDDDGGQGFGSRILHTSNSNEPLLIRVIDLNGSAGEFELIVR